MQCGDLCELSCDADKEECSGACIDTETDVQHCGSCQRPCTMPPDSSTMCVEGTCLQCALDERDCNGVLEDGCETDITSDLAHWQLERY